MSQEVEVKVNDAVVAPSAPAEPEKTVTTTKETEQAVSAEPGAAVVKTTEKESHKE